MGGTVNELVVWVVGLIGLYVLARLAKMLSDRASHAPRDDEPTAVRALVTGAVGAVLFLVAGVILNLLAGAAVSPPRCEGKTMGPGDACIVFGGGPGGGSYEEIRRRGG